MPSCDSAADPRIESHDHGARTMATTRTGTRTMPTTRTGTSTQLIQNEDGHEHGLSRKATMPRMIAVSAEGICRRYGRRWALVDVSFEVPEATVVMVAGPNGSG